VHVNALAKYRKAEQLDAQPKPPRSPHQSGAGYVESTLGNI
jgi:hypothetical protein